MAERRMISKSISTSLKINKLSDRAALLYTWMIPHTDDFGHLEGDPMSIRAKIVPMREFKIEEIENDVKEMVKVGVVKSYEGGGQKYIEINNFNDFQTFRPDRPRRMEYPFPPGSVVPDMTVGNQRQPTGVIVRRKLSEVKLSEVKGRVAAKAASPPKRKGIQKAEDDAKQMTLEEFAKWMEESPRRYIQIIGQYAEEKKPKFTTKGQWKEFAERSMRSAKRLEKFSKEQIEEAFERMMKDMKTEKNPRGFITKWGLETVEKYLTEI